MAATIKYNPKKRTFTGTNENDILDATTLDYVVPQTGKNKDKGLTIKGAKGNDIITGTTGNDIITGGAGENTVVVKMEKFGNDVVNLTKGEDLVIDLTAHTDLIELDDIRLTLVGKNLVITVPEDEEYDFGKITLKNYTKNTLNSLTFKFFEQEPITFNSFSELAEDTVFLYRNENLNKKGVLTASNYDDDIVIQNITNKKYTINAGNGKNEIGVMSGKYVINSGKNNDYISITDYDKKGSYTINAGGGENTIYIDNYGEYGEVIISEQKLNAINTIELSEDLKNPEYKRVKNDMYIVDDNGTIILKNYYANVKNKSTIKLVIGWDGEEQDLPDYLSEKTTEITGSGKINGTDSQDIITITGKANVTINAGKGDDTIGYAKGNRTIYLSEGDGNDIVEAGGGTDTLKFTSGTNVTAEVLYDIDGKTKLVVHYGTKGDSITFKEYNSKSKIYYYTGNKKHSLSSQLPIGNNIEITSYKTHYDGTDKNDTIVDSLVHTLENTITINALDGDDYIDAHHDIVHAGAGNDYVHSIDSSVFGEAGNDTIVNYGSSSNNNSSVEIYGGDGDDSILNEKYSYVKKIYGNDGDDVIINSGHVTNIIDGGEGNDKITLRNDSTISGELYGGSGNDNIVVESNVTVNTIYADSSNTQSANDGDDKVNIEGTVGTLYTTGGNDEINVLKGGTITTIYGGNGNDIITNYGSVYKVDGGGDNDTIINNKYMEYIYGGDGEDIINNEGSLQYIYGGAGNDIITTGENSSCGNINFRSGDGEDILYLNAKTNKLIFNDDNGDKKCYWVEDDLVISYNNGNDHVTIKNYNPNDENVKVNIEGLNLDFLISNYIDKVFNNILFNNHNTTVQNLTGKNNIDIIINNGTVSKNIVGNEGNDIITTGENSSCGNIIFNAGDGNDILYLNAKTNNLVFDSNVNKKCYWVEDDLVISYNNNEDSVTIKNYNPNDENVSVNINDLNISEMLLDYNGGNINYNNKTISELKGTDKIDYIRNDGKVSNYISGGAADDYIRNDGKVSMYISGGAADDYIINNGTVTDDIYDNSGNNTVINNGTVTENIRVYIGNDTIINNGTVKGEIIGGEGNDTIITGTSSSVNKISFSAGDGNDILYLNAKTNNLEFDDNEDKNCYWIESDLVISYNNDQDSVTIKNCNPHDANVAINLNNQALSMLPLNIIGKNFIIKYNLEDKSELEFAGTNGIDYMINYGTVKWDLRGYADNDIIINRGTVNESIEGGDGDDIIMNYSEVKQKIYGGEGNDTIENYRWNSDITLNGDEGDDTITNNGTVLEIEGGDGNDTITNNETARGLGANSITINGGSGNDTIINNGTVKLGSISGASGNDTIINNGTVQEYICGGAGDDIIITGENSSAGYIYFNKGDGNDILYLNASINKLNFKKDSGNKTYSWESNDLVISYNKGSDSVTIKNYNPLNDNIAVSIGTDDRNYNYVDLATLVPEKPITQTMSLGVSNTCVNELVLNELNYQTATFTRTSSTDIQLNYTTPDTNDISIVMSEYTNTDLQSSL